MKIGYSKLTLAVALFVVASHANAAATLIAAAVITVATYATAGVVAAIAVAVVATAVVAKSFVAQMQPGGADGYGSGSSPNPGNRQQVPPATDNKLPIVYGSAWLGGTVTDLSISENNKELYYVISLCEVTNNGADSITFGDVYWGGKKVLFKASGDSYSAIGTVSSVSGTKVYFNDISTYPSVGASFTFANTGSPTVYTVASSNSSEVSITFTASVSGVSSGATGYIKNVDTNYATQVTGLLDESTQETDTKVAGKLAFYFYSNGSYNPANSTTNAVSVMQTSGLVYKWDTTKLMTNCAFAIVHITYNQEAGLTGIQQTKFQVTNTRYKPGDCFYDYLTSNVYGAAVDPSQVDTASLDALNTYCDQSFTYTDYEGNTTTQTRFRFDGVVDTKRTIMDNLQDMSSCCDCLLRYNEIESKWGVITQSPTYTVAMALDDSNMVSSIQITPLDIAGTYNVIECKFPDETNQDSFNTATFDMAQVAPGLLFPNEPVNKQSMSLPLVNNDVRAQYLANRMLKGSREDLQVQVQINYAGIQLESGDVVTITNTNYGWVAKEFRVMKVTENFAADGSITADLVLTEFNASIYDDVNITQFQPAPNTGIADPLVFGNVPAPVVGASYPTNTVPLFLVNITASAQGIIQYAELWYSAFAHPTASQLIFAGTTEVESNGTPYTPGSVLPAVSVASIPAGTWYFFSRMVNSLGTSQYSPASAPFVWKPTTFQYVERYLSVAYADNATGTSNFSFSPTNRSYYGLCNQTGATPTSNPASYTWYLADPSFGTTKFLCYANQTNRRFSFATGFAAYAAGTGAFVPTQATIFDPRLWAALPNGENIIDLDHSTGQVIQTGTTTVGTGEISVTNNPDGKVVASLKQYLDFGSGVYSKTASAARLTIDIYGRVVGFEEPDSFYMTIERFTATSNQTVFNVTRSAGYISGQCLVFSNGTLADTSEYTDTGGTTGTVTFGIGRASGTIVTIISFKSVNSTTGVYASFTRNTATLTNASSYTPSGYSIDSGYELLFINGTSLTDQDYDIVGGSVTNFPSVVSGLITVIQWSQNNLTTPNGDPVNVVINTVIGQTTYPFSYTSGALNLYGCGVLLDQGNDYTTATGGYTLSVTPTTNTYTILQQTFARTGAV